MGALATARDRAVAAVGAIAMKTLSITGAGVPPAWFPIGWWQAGMRIPNNGTHPAVEACVAAISQTVASLPLNHWRLDGKGGKVKIIDSVVSHVLKKPNSYQTRADFVLNLLRGEQLEGNGYAVALRDDRFNINSLHLMSPSATQAQVAVDGSVFYNVQLPDVMRLALIESGALPPGTSGIFVPARDVLHIRMQTPRHALMGESPLLAAMMSVTAGAAINAHQAAFFQNMSRPSGFLKVPGTIKSDVAEKLREEWTQSFKMAGAGRVAVLQGGLDWVPLTMNAVDAAIIQSYRLTIQDIARVYRVPLAVIGELGGATYANTETLINHWLSTGLGFIIEHVELALEALFELPPNEFIAFDLDYLLRADFPARVEALTKGIQGGLFSPNEARNREGLPAVEFGEEPRVQAQVVPLSFAEKNPGAAASSTMPAAPAAGTTPPEDDMEDTGAEDDTEEEDDGMETEEDAMTSSARLRAEYLAILRKPAHAS